MAPVPTNCRNCPPRRPIPRPQHTGATRRGRPPPAASQGLGRWGVKADARRPIGRAGEGHTRPASRDRRSAHVDTALVSSLVGSVLVTAAALVLIAAFLLWPRRRR